MSSATHIYRYLLSINLITYVQIHSRNESSISHPSVSSSRQQPLLLIITFQLIAVWLPKSRMTLQPEAVVFFHMLVFYFMFQGVPWMVVRPGSPLQSLKRSQVPPPAAFRLLRHQVHFINLKGFDHPHLRVATCPQSMKMMDVSALAVTVSKL